MGFTPAEVDAMSLWEFASCVHGYGRAHGGDKAKEGTPMSEDRMRELGIEGLDV